MGEYRELMTECYPRRASRLRRAAAVALLALSGIVAFNGVALATDARAGSTPELATALAPPRLSYMINLATPGSYVGQYTYVECVGASVQMMRNMILGQSDHSAYNQYLLWNRARQWSKYDSDGGADPYGWASVLNFRGAGPYQIYSGASVADTVHALARAMALSGRPVGVTVWRGSHAWVVSGVTATDDPARTDAFTVLTVSVTDPLWTLRGPGRGIISPSTWMTVAQFGSAFLPYHDPRRDPAIEGRYIAIVPVPTSSELAVANSGRPVLTFGAAGMVPSRSASALP